LSAVTYCIGGKPRGGKGFSGPPFQKQRREPHGWTALKATCSAETFSGQISSKLSTHHQHHRHRDSVQAGQDRSYMTGAQDPNRESANLLSIHIHQHHLHRDLVQAGQDRSYMTGVQDPNRESANLLSIRIRQHHPHRDSVQAAQDRSYMTGVQDPNRELDCSVLDTILSWENPAAPVAGHPGPKIQRRRLPESSNIQWRYSGDSSYTSLIQFR